MGEGQEGELLRHSTPSSAATPLLGTPAYQGLYSPKMFQQRKAASEWLFWLEKGSISDQPLYPLPQFRHFMASSEGEEANTWSPHQEEGEPAIGNTPEVSLCSPPPPQGQRHWTPL